MRQPQAEGHRKPGRSFEDPSKPLGQELLDRSGPSETTPEDFRAREVQAGATRNGVAERAKAIAVMRKAEEMVADDNLPQHQKSVLRALELASGRVGLTYPEYRALVKGDPELEALEQRVLAEAIEQLS